MITRNIIRKDLTIDLRAMECERYLSSKSTIMEKFTKSVIKYMSIAGAIWFIIVLFIGWGILVPENTNASNWDEINATHDRIGTPNPYDHIIGCVNSSTHEVRKPLETSPERGFAKCYIGRGWQNITLREWSLPIYEKYNITETRKLDLLTINSIECADRMGMCNRNNSDIGPFQQNYIHKNSDNISKKVWRISADTIREPGREKAERMYSAQMLWVTIRMIRQEENNCDVSGEYWNMKRFKCLAVLHNGNKKIDANGLEHRYNYASKGWEVRKYIKQYLKDTK